MHAFIISFIASIVAIYPIYWITQSPYDPAHLFSAEAGVYLNVKKKITTIDKASFVNISAHNASRKGFKPLEFHPTLNNSPLLIIIENGSSKESVSHPSLPFIKNTELGGSETIEVLIISDSHIDLGEVDKLFSASYLYEDQRGMLKPEKVIVRDQLIADKESADRKTYLICIIVILISLVIIIFYAYRVSQTRKKHYIIRNFS